MPTKPGSRAATPVSACQCLLSRSAPPKRLSENRPERRMPFARTLGLGHRHVDHASPFGPGSVVVSDLVVAEQVFEDEPGVRRALTDAAIGDYFFFRRHSLT